MSRRFVIFAAILIVGSVLWSIDPTNERLVAGTIFALAGLYLVFVLTPKQYTARNILDNKISYNLRKVLTALLVMVPTYAERGR